MKYDIPEDDYDIAIKKNIDKPNTDALAKTSVQEKAEDDNNVQQPTPEPGEKKRGRPAKQLVRTSIAIEEDLGDILLAGASYKYKGNRSAYINALIRTDYEKNKEIYDKFLEIKNL